MKEVFTFELIVHCAPEYPDSINRLKAQIAAKIGQIAEVADVEIELTERRLVNGVTT